MYVCIPLPLRHLLHICMLRPFSPLLPCPRHLFTPLPLLRRLHLYIILPPVTAAPEFPALTPSMSHIYIYIYMYASAYTSAAPAPRNQLRRLMTQRLPSRPLFSQSLLILVPPRPPPLSQCPQLRWPSLSQFLCQRRLLLLQLPRPRYLSGPLFYCRTRVAYKIQVRDHARVLC